MRAEITKNTGISRSIKELIVAGMLVALSGCSGNTEISTRDQVILGAATGIVLAIVTSGIEDLPD